MEFTFETKNTPPSTTMPVFVRILIAVAGLIAAIPTLFAAAMFTAFAGSGHGTPDWILVYLGITQAIPIVVAFIAWLALIFTGFMSPNRVKLLKVLVGAVVCYVFSFGGLLLILPK